MALDSNTLPEVYKLHYLDTYVSERGYRLSDIMDVYVVDDVIVVETETSGGKNESCGALLTLCSPREKRIERYLNYNYYHSNNSYKNKLKTYFLQSNHEICHINKFPCIERKHIVHCQCYSE